MKQKIYKEMKKQIREESAYGVGFYEGIFSALPDYALVEAVKTLASEGWISPHTDDGAVRNMLVTEAIKEMNYQDFKKAAPFFFSYPREQREKDALVRPIEISRSYFEKLQAQADELLQLKQERINGNQNLEEKFQELEMDRVENGDRVVGVDRIAEKLLLLRKAENAYLNEWEIVRDSQLIADYRSAFSIEYQILNQLGKDYPPLQVAFEAAILNRDRTEEGVIYLDRDSFQETPGQVLPDFPSHESYYLYAREYPSFRKEYPSWEDYVSKTYSRDYPGDYGLRFHAQEVLAEKMEMIQETLKKDEKELILHEVKGYSQGESFQCGYIRYTDRESREEVWDYLEHTVGAYFRGSLTEVAVIPFSALTPQGYNGDVDKHYLVDEEQLWGKASELTKLKELHADFASFQSLEELEKEEHQSLSGLSL